MTAATLAAAFFGRQHGMQRRMLSWPLAMLFVLALHAAGAYFVLQLRIDNAPEVYYRDDAPAVLLRNQLRRDFPSDEVMTVLFQGEDLYTQGFLQRLDKLSGLLERNPLVDRVTTISSLERISGSSDGFAVEALADTKRQKSPEALRRRVLEDRFAPGTLASRDGSALAMAVRPKPLSESSERLALKIAVASAIHEAGLESHYAGDAGPVTIDVAQLSSVLEDTKAFVPATVTIGLLLLWWVVGRLKPVLIGAVAMSTVVLPMVAAVSIAQQPYTMATAILPSLLAAYTLATLLHLYAAVQRGQTSGATKAASVDRALGDTLKPGAYNVLTTGAGLLSLVLVPIPPIQVFGLAGALGTLLVFLTVFFLVPPILLRFDTRPWPTRGSGMNKLGRIASRLTLTSMRRPKMVVAVAAALVVATIPMLERVQVESDVLAFFAPQHPISQHTRLIESKLAGVTSLEISLVGQGRDSFQDVERLAAVRDFQRWAEALPEVDRSVSMVDLVEEMHWAMNDEKAAFRTLPGNNRLLKQYLLVYDGRDLYELVNRDFEHARILLNLNVHGANQIGRTIEHIRQRLAAHPIDGVQVDVGGYGRLFADQVDLLVTGQINSFSGAFGQIFILMALLWRSLSASALCLVPNLAPLFFIFVLMGATGMHLDLATVMIAGVILGITVDDTIHLYHGYRHRLTRGISPLLAIARSFESSGRAVLAISVVLIAQFAVMTTSEFKPTANFGLLTAVGLLSGQLAELLLLPALLVLKDVRTASRTSLRSLAGGWFGRRGAGTANAPAWDDAAGAPAEDSAWPATRVLAQPGPTEAWDVGTVLICQGEACRRLGASRLRRKLVEDHAELTARGQAIGWVVARSSCLGRCERAPVVQLVQPGVFCSGQTLSETVRTVRRHLAASGSKEPAVTAPGR